MDSITVESILWNFKQRHQLFESVLPVQTCVPQIPLFALPFGKSAIIVCLLGKVYPLEFATKAGYFVYRNRS